MRARALALAALALAGAAGAGAARAGAAPRAAPPPVARTVTVAPGGAAAALAAAGPGDTLVLAPGTHPGPLVITAPLTLRGTPGARIEGGGRGTVLTVAVAGATVEDLALEGSGADIMNIDAAVHIVRGAGVTLRRLRVRDVLYGVYAEHADSARIEDCDLSGRVEHTGVALDASGAAMAGDGSGNGIHLWSCSAARISGNAVRHFQDAVYMSFTNRTAIESNILTANGRFGLHTMYCQQNRLRSNQFMRNVAGCAIMFSNHLDVRDNDFAFNRGSRTYGLLLKDCSDGDFNDNRMIGNTIAVFMDNSNRNRFRGNLFQNNGWGLFIFSSCAGNLFAANDFIRNDYPVALDMRYTDNRFDDGARGNYWDENPVYDLDGDGVGDVPYSPVGAFAFVSKQYPDLTVLAKSPAVVALGVAERVMPALRPSEALDRHPLVRPVAVPPSRAAGDAAASAPRAWGALAMSLAMLGAGLAGLRRAGSRS